ncbi:phosphoribosylglycinamide formyltransferase [Sedimenticola sp.]|uniref:phosphoribosylglycinamide formyltransferase n=1 Tax=Sedimenticola sp. TaxID=1940285 RepID=UPI003D09E8B3
MTQVQKLPIVVLISGSGSNLQAIIDGAAADLPVEIRAVISNRADAFGLERAQRAAIPTRILDHTNYPDRETYDRALVELIDSFQPGLVILAGFMRILTPALVNHFQGKLLNIHPSLLPKYRGLHTHQRALEAGDPVHGASVHLVTEELDGGPVILQVRVPIEPGDDESTLAARVLTQEHQIYPRVIRWFAEGRLRVTAGSIELDGQPLQGPIVMEFNQLNAV